MSVDTLLERLQGVKRTGPDRAIGICPVPSHEDRRPSLSVRELEDGRVLVHCFAGCSVEEVIAAVGLDWSALFPVDWPGRKFKKAPGIPASDILKAIDFETLVVSIIAGDLHEKREISDADYQRLELARKRINAAREASRGRC